MQKQKVLSLFSVLAVALMLVAMGSNTASASKAQATAAGTPAAPTATLPSVVPQKVDVPGTGKVTGPLSGETDSLTGSGATFPLLLYNVWIRDYSKLTNVNINYKGVGSGQGRKDFISQAVDFAGSDAPMSDDEIKAAKATGGDEVHVATTLGGIVPVYNIPELVGKDALKLTGDELAQIYEGHIKTWNDPALVADNPGLKDINQPINTIARSDGSGTTQNFTAFLVLSNKEWADTVKSAATVSWPTEKMTPAIHKAPGNPGVRDEVKNTKYSIGYVELGFATQLQSAAVKNGAGKFVTASTASISAAADGIALPDDLRLVLIGKITNPEAYPITTWTWLLAYTDQKDPAVATALTRFLWWATHDGQGYAKDLGYAPLPAAAIAKDEVNILKIMVAGKQALPADIATPGAMMAATMAPTK